MVRTHRGRGADLSDVRHRGRGLDRPRQGEPVLLRPGDIAIARGPEPYTVADTPDAPPRAVIGPDGACTTLSGEPLAETMRLGVRTWGNAPDGGTTLLVGTYRMDGEVGRRLLDALPGLLHLPSEEWNCPLTPFLGEEIARDEPGQTAVLDRVLDLMLITGVRAWFSRPGAEAPAWYRAMGDPVVGRALRLLQNDPAHPWTVASLATKAGVSRPRSPAASPNSSGSPRWRTSRAGGSRSPPICCARPTSPSSRSPARSATAVPSR